MEVVGGIAAVVQLVQTLGTTITRVSDAYSQVRDMDDLVRDLDNQLDAIRMLLSILGDGISCGSLNPSIQGWWRQSELERLLRSCQQLFNRLHNIFIKIARQRSTVKNLRAWVRLKGYDNDINHLRLSINTCTNALQLPVIIHNIHSSGQARSAVLLEGEVPDLVEELATRVANLESSMARAKDDLVMRALQRHQEQSSPTRHLKSIENMIKELRSEMSTLAASQRTQTSTASPTETEAQLAQIQDTLSQLHIGVSHGEEDSESILKPQEAKEKSDMDNETRSMLEFMDGLVGSVQDYVSTIGSMSVSTKLTRCQSRTRAHATGDSGDSTFQTRQGLNFPPAQLSKDKRLGIVNWVDNVDDEDNSSVTPSPSALGLCSEGSEETIVTPITTQSGNTATSGNKLLAELEQRRIRIVEHLMRTKNYKEALPHLERLLVSNDDATDANAKARLCYFMARVLSETRPEDVMVDSYCQRFPLIKSKLDDLRLDQATKALRRKDYTLVTSILRPYEVSFTSEIDSGSTGLVDINTLHKIQLIFGQALLESTSYKQKHKAMSILEALLGESTLKLTGRGDSHDCLAKAYYFKGDYEKAKKHGILACQIKMDLKGRDDEETKRSIALIANICHEAQDSDEAIWRQMLPDPTATDKPQVEPPGRSKFRDTHRIPRLKEDIVCFDCLARNLDRSLAFSFSWARTACLKHETKLKSGCVTRGLSLLHYFAMTKPRGDENSNGSPRPDCISELSILIDQAKTTVAQVSDQKAKGKTVEPPTSFPLMHQLNHGFLVHEMINMPMHHILSGSQRRKAIDISPLWGAALSGHLSTVSFFLSLKETDVTVGSISILLLRRPYRQDNSHSFPPGESRSRPEARFPQNDLDVFRAVSAAFNALPGKWAQWLLARHIRQGEQDLHWCFANHSLLEKVLGKCGKNSADSLVDDWLSPCPRDRQLSLLDNFLSFISTQSGEGLEETTREEFTAMLRLLLKHSKTHRTSAFCRHRITGLVYSIREAVDLMFDSAQPISRPAPRSEQEIIFWVELIEVLVDNGCVIEDKDRLLLQACVDRLTICDQELANKENVREGLCDRLKILKKHTMKAQRGGSVFDAWSVSALRQRKEKTWKKISDLEGPMKALVAKLEIRNKLRDLCDDIRVHREGSPAEVVTGSCYSMFEPDIPKQTEDGGGEAGGTGSANLSKTASC